MRKMQIARKNISEVEPRKYQETRYFLTRREKPVKLKYKREESDRVTGGSYIGEKNSRLKQKNGILVRAEGLKGRERDWRKSQNRASRRGYSARIAREEIDDAWRIFSDRHHRRHLENEYFIPGERAVPFRIRRKRRDGD